MKKLILALFIVIQVGANAQEEHYRTLLDSANGAYADKDYNAALELYSEVEQFGFFSSQLYYNKANTHYRLGDIPKAILYYERALILDPGNEDIAYNLSVCNKLITDNMETLPEFFLSTWLRQLAHLLPMDTWAILSLVFLLIAAICTVILIRSKSMDKKKWSLIGTFAAGVFMLLSVFFAQFIFSESKNNNYAIVFDESLDINAEPNENSTTLYVVHEGLKVRILKSTSDWVRIELPNGNIGWVTANSLAVI